MVAILVTGGSGQVGKALGALDWPGDVQLWAPDRHDLDLANPASVAAAMARQRWDVVINCAAYTAVDLAEAERFRAFAVNAHGAAHLAAAAFACDTPMLQVSTDFVFAGDLGRPCREDDPTRPLSVYGASKLAGELAVRFIQPRSVVLRTSWVVSASGSNFLMTILRLAATSERLRVVGDQLGSPTGAADLALALQVIALRLARDPAAPLGTYHFSNAGQASRAEFAAAIVAASASLGGRSPEVEAIATADYVTQARRPADSRLDCARLHCDYALYARPWQDMVKAVVSQCLLPGPTSGGMA